MAKMLANFKLMFFDKPKVANSMDKKTKSVFSKFGAFVRTTARQSIKSKKFNEYSKPGNPPFSHTGLLKKFILFGYDNMAKSVVIGPAKLNKKGDVPEVLEYGGNSQSTTAYITKKTVRGNRLHAQKKKIKIAARPYMRPAFQKELPKLDSMWKNSITV